jgi:hypothetical protein
MSLKKIQTNEWKKKTIQDMKEEINKDKKLWKIIWNKQLNSPNKYSNQKLGEQSGAS